MAVRFTRDFGKANVMIANGHTYADEIMTLVILDKSFSGDIIVYRDPDEDEGIFVVFFDLPCVKSLSKYDKHNACRSNGVEYSSCGLAWLLYGERVLGSTRDWKSVWNAVDRDFIQEIDRMSNLQFGPDGEMPCFGKTLSERIFALNHEYPYEERGKAYKEAVSICEEELNLAIAMARANV